MDQTILLQTSIIASFLAGMIALFAPCCVSYLLPAYLGSVFKERKRVLFMTIIYSLGIFAVMIPAVLGSKLISLYVFRYHDQVYLLGGVFMVIVGITSLLGLRFPMPHIRQSRKQGTDIASVFTLGIFSGITSACCAPVLVGVLTLSFLSPSLWQALLIGFVYVLGMVTPLYIGSYFLDSKKVLGLTFFKRKIGEVRLPLIRYNNRKGMLKTYPIIMGNVISFIIFTLTGLLVVYLTLATDFSMAEMAQGFSSNINGFAIWLNGIPGANSVFLIAIVMFIFVVIKHAFYSKNGKNAISGKQSKKDYRKQTKEDINKASS